MIPSPLTIRYMTNPFFQQHFLSTDQLTKETIPFLFQEIDAMKEIALTKGKTNILEGKIIALSLIHISEPTRH